MKSIDSPDRKAADDKAQFEGESPAESSCSHDSHNSGQDAVSDDEILSNDGSDHSEVEEGMDPAGYSGPSEKIVKPLTPEALAAFKAAQERAGIVYISRIPPGMQPAKVRHFMSAYGEVGRVYLQQEDAKRAYLRRKYTTTKKAHFTEGWVEFKDKKIARGVAEMLNAQPIGGKKGSRWRDDVWTMKYLPKFKWTMLTEQVAHEAAMHTAKLRVELSQSRSEQKEYLRNVELARVLDKRRERGKEPKMVEKRPREEQSENNAGRKKRKEESTSNSKETLDAVLSNIF